MPTVELPDGTEIEFPEGTSQATINKVSADTWAKSQGNAPAKSPQEQMRAQADAAAQKEYQQAGFGYDLVDVGRQAIKGIPLAGGLMDEGVALASSALGGDYDKSLEYQRARDRLREENFPVSSTAVQVAGGIAGTMAGANALGIGGMGVNAARPLAQRALAGAAIGAPVGAIDGFTRGEGGLENRAGSALVGGAFGGFTGAAAPIIGQGVSSGYQNIKNALTPSASYRALGVSRDVGEELVDSLGADASKKGLARIRAAGPNAMIADAGPNAQGVADAVIQKRGPGASVLGDAIEQRSKQANRDLQGTLDRTFGAPEGKLQQITGIRESTEAAREAAYKGAYSKPIDYSTEAGRKLESLFDRVPVSAWQYANSLMKTSGMKSKQIIFKVDANGDAIIERMPDVRQLDYVKRAIDAVADEADGKGKLGGTTDLGREYRILSRELRDALKTNVDEYRVALETAADPISRIEGVKLGSKLLNDKFTRSELAQEMKGMTGPEREAVKSGLRAQLDEITANVKSMASSPDVEPRQLQEMMRQLSSGATREKIFMVLNSRKATAQFFREIDQAFKAATLRASVAVNSKTAARQNLIQGIDERMKPGAIGTAMEGNLPGATQRVIQLATGATPRQQRLRNNDQWLELAKLLSEKRGRGAEEMLRKLIAAANARAASSATGQKLGTGAAGAVAGSIPAQNELANRK
jgi:hypothetical protein